MRNALLIVVLFAVGVGAASLIATPRAGARSTVAGTITGGVNNSAVLSLSVTSVAPGTYEFDINDSTGFHNFDICPGVDRCTDATSLHKTEIAGTGSVVWMIDLAPGTYTYQCDAHSSMTKHFTVTDGASTTTTTTPTTSTAPALTVRFVSTLATRRVVTVKAKASQLSHVTGYLVDKKTGTQLATAALDGTAVTLKLRPATKLTPGRYIVKLMAECCGTSAMRQKTILVT